MKSLQNQLKCSIEGNKENYYLRVSKTMIDPTTNGKTYWSIFKTLLNNKKLPCIPPLFHQGKYVTNFKTKGRTIWLLLCQTIFHNTKLKETSLNISKKTEKSISSITFNCNDIAAIIRSLDLDKAYGYNMISIPMLKICDKFICKPLELWIPTLHQTRKFSQWMENGKCGFCPQEKWSVDFIKLLASISTSHLCKGFLSVWYITACLNISLRAT